MILGKGNSGFEMAELLTETTAMIHVCSPNPIKMARATHPVGHLRAVNNNFLDTYQLKTQNGVLGWPAGQASVIGWLLQTKALIMIVFANVLLDKQVITSQTFTALLLMAVASTMLTVPMVTPLLGRLGLRRGAVPAPGLPLALPASGGLTKAGFKA